MRKIDTSPISSTAQMPVKSGTLVHLQLAYQEGFSAVITNLINQLLFTSYSSTTAYILWGVQAFPGTPNTVISTGAVYFNGEIFLVDSQTIASPTGGQVIVANINTTTYFTDPTADPVTFTDLSTHNVHQIRKITFVAGNSGTGGVGDFTGNSSVFTTLIRMPQAQNISTGIGFGSPQTVSFATSQYINFSGSLTGTKTINFSFIGAIPGNTVMLEAAFDNTGGTTSIVLDSTGCTLKNYSGNSILTITGLQTKWLEFTYKGQYFGNPLVVLKAYSS